MVVQIAFMMPIDTTVTYQYRYGLSMDSACRKLYNGGGIVRLYSGILPALLQGPLSRFGDTASNAAVIAIMEKHPETKGLPIVAQTLLGSVAAASWRILLMPLDVTKTMAQVHGSKQGWHEVAGRFREAGVGTLWRGSSASFLSTVCSHLPWYTTFNFLNKHLPRIGEGSAVVKNSAGSLDKTFGTRRADFSGQSQEGGLRTRMSAASSVAAAASSLPETTSSFSPADTPPHSRAPMASSTTGTSDSWLRALRHGAIGFTASVVSDCCTNSLRVIKAIRQAEGISYSAAVSLVTAQDGLRGLFGRGLKTRILANGSQSLLFTALWKSLEETIEERCFGSESAN